MPRFSVNNNNTYPNNIIIVHRIFYANLAGLLMHCPGLVVKWEYEDLWPEYIQSICGASVEGCFLVSDNIFIFMFEYQYNYDEYVVCYLLTKNVRKKSFCLQQGHIMLGIISTSSLIKREMITLIELVLIIVIISQRIISKNNIVTNYSSRPTYSLLQYYYPYGISSPLSFQYWAMQPIGK